MSESVYNRDQVTRCNGNPVVECRRWLADCHREYALLVVDFTYDPWWLEGAPSVQLSAIYLYSQGRLTCTVTDQTLEVEGLPPIEQYQAWLQRYQLFSAQPGDPLPLRITSIPKPWGQELWYTGVEERGVCEIGDADAAVPIPWLQAVLPDDRAGASGQPLVLLKVLDPAPAEVTGDLYFELHEEKREVYVVTHVDPEAWPGGTGYIRYGFDPDKVAAAPTEADFRAGYLEAVKAYEAVRRRIDALPDGDDPEPTLVQQESSLRREMEAFTHMRPLKVGDVVVVPLHMPHSLQHGVRTIEFQTPVYERKILSFAQKVLTQGHWDTEEGVQLMRLLPPEEQAFESVYEEPDVTCERIVDFSDFEVRRIRLAAGAQHGLPVLPHYSLLMLVEGRCPVGSLSLGPEEAAIIPAECPVILRSESADQPLVALLALPRE